MLKLEDKKMESNRSIELNWKKNQVTEPSYNITLFVVPTNCNFQGIAAYVPKLATCVKNRMVIKYPDK